MYKKRNIKQYTKSPFSATLTPYLGMAVTLGSSELCC